MVSENANLPYNMLLHMAGNFNNLLQVNNLEGIYVHLFRYITKYFAKYTSHVLCQTTSSG